MDVSYINTLLSTSSVKFKTLINDEPYFFFVKVGNSSLDSNNNLIVKDYIEDKTFTIPASAEIFEAHGRDEIFFKVGDSYEEFVKKQSKKIARSNKLTEEEFNEIKLMAGDTDKSAESLQILKSVKPIETLIAMKKLGLTDLASFYTGGERAAVILRKRSLELLNITAIEAKAKLNDERAKFIEDGDSDSVEEIDIILGMIDDEVSATTFETVSSVEDIYTQWPPILLPVPFER
jgi:hypothetical protein